MTNQVANRKEQNQLVVSVATRVQKMVEERSTGCLFQINRSRFW